MPGSVAFWSYAHDDNEADSGGVLALAEALRAEFSLLTGTPLELFVDRQDLRWGDQWRARIDNALVETTFFVPILSPRYFTREECRRELLEFHAQARSLGVTELILPILYAPVPDLVAKNSDEAVALCARLQYVDWQELRLSDRTSAEYRTAVNTLAKRLAETSSAVAAQQVESEREETSPGDAQLDEVIRAIERLLPSWISAVDDDQVAHAQHTATMRILNERLRKAPPKPGSLWWLGSPWNCCPLPKGVWGSPKFTRGKPLNSMSQRERSSESSKATRSQLQLRQSSR